MTEPQIIRASDGEELVVLTRAAYDALVAAAGAADDGLVDAEDADDLAGLADAAKAEWEAAGRPVIPLSVLRRVRAGDSYLRAFRLEARLTQSDLAARAGITQGYLSECETSRKAPNAATRDVLAKALGIHPIWLDQDAPQPAEAMAGSPEAVTEEEELYARAVDLVTREQRSEVAFVQRRLSIGYNKAASLLHRMERDGIVGPARPDRTREILAPRRGA